MRLAHVLPLLLVMWWPFSVFLTSFAGLGQRPESLDQRLAQVFELGDLRLLLR